MSKELVALGTFENISGEMMISDPGYKLGTWCQGIIKDILKGEWTGFVKKSDEGEWGVRCGVVYAIHSSLKNEFLKDNWVELDWKELKDVHVGVDSGQAGIFDLKHYRDSSVITNDPEFPFGGEWKEADNSDRWYSACCDITLSEMGAGVLPFGVVSSSGYGDGSYVASIIKNIKDMVVAIRIDFLGE